jgi:hypothetical protein
MDGHRFDEIVRRMALSRRGLLAAVAGGVAALLGEATAADPVLRRRPLPAWRHDPARFVGSVRPPGNWRGGGGDLERRGYRFNESTRTMGMALADLHSLPQTR